MGTIALLKFLCLEHERGVVGCQREAERTGVEMVRIGERWNGEKLGFGAEQKRNSLF